MTTYEMMSSENNPPSAGKTTSWSYDNRGNMIKKTKADNSVIRYEYDNNALKGFLKRLRRSKAKIELATTDMGRDFIR